MSVRTIQTIRINTYRKYTLKNQYLQKNIELFEEDQLFVEQYLLVSTISQNQQSIRINNLSILTIYQNLQFVEEYLSHSNIHAEKIFYTPQFHSFIWKLP